MTKVEHREEAVETVEPSDLRQIREEANQRGVGPTTLVRMWVREHLRALGGQPAGE